MIRGIYASASGMGVQQARMDVISNNLANLSVNGFKRDTVTAATFSEMLLLTGGQFSGRKNVPDWDAVDVFNQGAAVTAISTDFSTGDLRETNGQLDVAITGEGFFAINVPTQNDLQRVAYTRDGSFHRDADGYLSTATGHRVLSTDFSPITLPDGNIYISPTGVIMAGDDEVGQLALIIFDDVNQPVREGNGFYTDPEQTGRQHDNPSLHQGYVERANVDSAAEMTSMLTALRAYEAGQRIIQAHDELLGKAVNQVGAVR